MKLDVTVPVGALASALAAVDRAVERKPTIPVLGNVLLEAGSAGVRVSATDTQIGMRARCSEAPALLGGAVTLPAHTLLGIVSQLDGDDVRITEGDTTVSLQCGRFRAKIATLPVSDFPALALPYDDDPSITLPRARFHEAIVRTKFATGSKAKDLFLDGAFLEVGNNTFRMVATDRYRLAIVDAPRDDVNPLEASIVPRRTLDALNDMTRGDGPDVGVAIGENHIFFTVGDRLLISRKIDAAYPKYSAFIQPLADRYAVLTVNTFASALRRLGAMSDQVQRRVAFAVTKNAMTLTGENAMVGDAEEHLDIDYDGADLQFAINGKYVLDFLDHCDTDHVTMSVIDPNRPVTFTAENDAVYTYIVQTMR